MGTMGPAFAIIAIMRPTVRYLAILAAATVFAMTDGQATRPASRRPARPNQRATEAAFPLVPAVLAKLSVIPIPEQDPAVPALLLCLAAMLYGHLRKRGA